jgi:hypothetical protein
MKKIALLTLVGSILIGRKSCFELAQEKPAFRSAIHTHSHFSRLLIRNF